MSRLYLLCVLVIAGAALLGLAIAADAGYVLIRYDRFRYQASFWVFVAVIVALWLAILGLRMLLRLLGASGGLINPWSRRHRSRRVRLAARRGLLDLAEGRWARAPSPLRLEPKPARSRPVTSRKAPGRRVDAICPGMRQRDLGKTGLKVSELALGTFLVVGFLGFAVGRIAGW